MRWVRRSLSLGRRSTGMGAEPGVAAAMEWISSGFGVTGGDSNKARHCFASRWKTLNRNEIPKEPSISGGDSLLPFAIAERPKRNYGFERGMSAWAKREGREIDHDKETSEFKRGRVGRDVLQRGDGAVHRCEPPGRCNDYDEHAGTGSCNISGRPLCVGAACFRDNSGSGGSLRGCSATRNGREPAGSSAEFCFAARACVRRSGSGWGRGRAGCRSIGSAA